MSHIVQAATLVVRQLEGLDEATTTVPLAGQPGHCDTGNEYDGRMGVRISAIFVILVGSLFGATFPVFLKRRTGTDSKFFNAIFFAAKYFGSGVIIATAFIHLLSPAHDALTNGCLTGPITEYSWVEGICLMTIFVLFFAELMTMRYGNFGRDHAHAHGDDGVHAKTSSHKLSSLDADSRDSNDAETKQYHDSEITATADQPHQHLHRPGADHLGHARDHKANENMESNWESLGMSPESYAAQMTAIFILEFGVIFHSIFIGLTLAVSGEEFNTLYVVLVFHQTFEGLGLGTRLSAAPWPKSKRWTPYILGFAYALSTPIAIAIGLGVRNTYPPNSATTLILNGVFDSISAGILIYTGLVELMAHEFMFSPTMQRARIGTVLNAFVLMCLGAGLMALLGKWA